MYKIRECFLSLLYTSLSCNGIQWLYATFWNELKITLTCTHIMIVYAGWATFKFGTPLTLTPAFMNRRLYKNSSIIAIVLLESEESWIRWSKYLFDKILNVKNKIAFCSWFKIHSFVLDKREWNWCFKRNWRWD